MSDQQLMKHLNFDESELQTNRNGGLSEKQKARLQISNSGSKAGALILGLIFVAAALLGLGIGAIVMFGSGDLSNSLVAKIILVTVFGCIWPLIWGTAGFFSLRRVFTKMEVKVKKVEGPINIVKVIRKSYNSSTETYTDYSAYELRVGGRTFDVRSDLPNAMLPGDAYAVYYADFNLTEKKKEVLSAEMLIKGSGAFVPQVVSLEDAQVVEYLKKGDLLGAIRMHRSIHGTNLEDAKNAVEEIKTGLENTAS